MTLHAQIHPSTHTQATRTSRLAVASFVLGVLGIHGVLGILSFGHGFPGSFLPSMPGFSFPHSGLTDVVGPILALVFGYTAKHRIGRAGGTLRGRGLAIAGIILGGIVVAAFWLVVIMIVVLVLHDGGLGGSWGSLAG
jgi:Domain of unknown function (DUF4190)